mmetsp:Transcript_138376/g.385986  ORF Transcript_138376/g.385986 Transcript_138376/m.385986 type:complete len:228 (-) Transcript_138376:79-762(-)
MLSRLVVRKGVVVSVSFVEVIPVRVISVAKKIETQAAWVQGLIARPRHIIFHGGEEIVRAVWIDVECDNKSEPNGSGPPCFTLEGPGWQRSCFHLGHRLAYDTAAGLELCPRVVVRCSLVVSSCSIVNVALVEDKCVGVLRVSEQVEAKTPRVQRAVTRARHVVLHCYQEIIDAIWNNCHRNKHAASHHWAIENWFCWKQSCGLEASAQETLDEACQGGAQQHWQQN